MTAGHVLDRCVERRRVELENGAKAEKANSLASADLPTTIADSFAQTVESLLKAWHFPEAGRVFYDPKARDLVISGKSRSAFGKGLPPSPMPHSRSR